MNKRFNYIALAVLLFITTLLYLPSLNNKFNNWDDAAYFLNNPHLELTKANIEKSFLQGEVHRMYIPLTALSNSIVYHFYGLNPKPYILINLLIHLCNILLMFIFISHLIKNPYVPIITAALFALHPMQVESVAYAAGRRDVLYVLFYLLCMIFYILYLDRKKHNVLKYIFSLFFALLALFSKGQALTIPFTLILLSLFKNEKWNSKAFWLDKLPYFFFSAVIAYKVFSATQYAEGNFTSTSYLDVGIPILYRIIYACYEFVQYIILLLFPYKLSLVHPYPEVNGGHGIPTYYYLYVLILLGLVYFFFRYAIRKRTVWFGLAFFAINIFMLLQLVPNSYGIMNDHYVYFAGIGIFLIVGEKVYDVFLNKKYATALIFIFGIYIIVLGFSSFQRMDVFRNSIAEWSDVIKKYPDCYMAYNNRGLAYYNKRMPDKAFNDYTKAMELKPKYEASYNNRGVIFNDQGLYDKAIDDFSQAIKLDSNFADAYYNRGNAWTNKGLWFIAIDDFTKAIKLNPDNAFAYNNRGTIYNEEGLSDKACQDFQKAEELGSKEAKENVEKICNNK